MAEVSTQGQKRTIEEAEGSLHGVKVILLDIEGTTTPITFVKEKMFTYVRENLKHYLETRWESDELQADIGALRDQVVKDKEDKVEDVPEIPPSETADKKEDSEDKNDIEMKEDKNEEKGETNGETKREEEGKKTEEKEVKETKEKKEEEETKEEKKEVKETKEKKEEEETKEEKKEEKETKEKKKEEKETKEEKKKEEKETKEEKKKEEKETKEDKKKEEKETKETEEKGKDEKKPEEKTAVEDKPVTFNADILNAVIKNIVWQMDKDRKTIGLKQLQAHMWREAFKTKKLVGDVFDDAAEAMKTWSSSSKKVYIYSSGSVEAQKMLFGHTESGDLTEFLSGYFDLKTGPKDDKSSYVKIAKECGVKPEEVIFLTDVAKEAKAASEAGMKTNLVIREGNAPLTDEDKSAFSTISSFSELATDSAKSEGEPPEKK